MDVCIIDVTDIDCKTGDRVEIFGEQLPVTEIAEKLDTIPYEILTSVSTRGEANLLQRINTGVLGNYYTFLFYKIPIVQKNNFSFADSKK